MTETARAHPRIQSAPLGPNLASIRSANVSALLSQVVCLVILTRSICDPLFVMIGTDLNGSSITFGAVINALVIALVALFVIEGNSAPPIAVFAIWLPYLLVAFLATLYAPNFTSAARIFLVILSYWSMFALPFFMLRTRAQLPRFLLLVLASSIVPSLYALWDIWHGLANWHDFRLQSTFPHPNIFAFYLVLMLGLALYVRTSTAARWPPGVRAAMTLYIPLLLLFLALTKTRGAWMACAIMFLVYALWFDRRLLVATVVLPILLSTDSIVGDRLSDLSRGGEIESFSELNANNQWNSLAWREALWRSALEAVAQRPILGHGLESFRPSALDFFPLTGPEGVDAHNLYLQILFEMGAMGLIAYLWLMGSLLWWIKKGAAEDPKGMVIVFTIIAAYLLESYADNMLYYLSFNWYFMFTMGAICAWISSEQDSASEQKDWLNRSACFATRPSKLESAG
jgi:putative inorganic carbon (HCO3(-)) transporter